MLFRLLVVLVTVGWIPATASAQDKFSDLFGGALDVGPGQVQAETVSVSARLIQVDAVTVELQVEVTPPDGFYIYSMATPSGQKTKITLTETAGLEPSQQGFSPDHPAKREYSEDFEADVEKFLSTVTWSQRLTSATPLTGTIRVSGNVKGQICSTGVGGTCVLLRPAPEFSAELATQEMPAEDTTPSEASDIPSAVTVTLDETPIADAKIGYTVSLSPAQAKVGEEVTLLVRADMPEDWHTYSTTFPPDQIGGSPTVIDLSELHGLESVDSDFTPSSEPVLKEDPILGGDPFETHDQTVTWSRRFVVTEPDASVAGSIMAQVCSGTECLLPRSAEFAVALGGSTDVQPFPFASVAADAPAENTSSVGELTQRGVAAAAKKEGLLFFLLAAVGAGYVALLTPCVFPMIPVTVAFFLKQEESGKGNSKLLAVIYCLGIVGTFTVVGVVASAIFGHETMTELANGPWLNLLFALVFVVFALMLLGVFEIRIPTAVLNWSAQREGQGGIVGVLFMAFTFTLVSFTCTAAFVAGLLVEAAKGDYLWPTLGMLAFSAAFASPFFFLALFPGYLSSLPKSGGWMNKVKCTAGLVELAFVVKFLSVADIGFSPDSTPQFLDFTTTMVLWATLALVTGMYILGMFRFTKDTPPEGISPIGGLWGMTSIGLCLFICVGLFSADPPNNWLWNQLAGFAPPEFEREVVDDQFSELAEVKNWLSHDGLAYALEVDDGVKVAKSHARPLFIDFTGVNCINCRTMEKSVLNQPEILGVLATVPRAQLFLDEVPHVDEEEEDRILERNLDLCVELTGGAAMPTYVVLAPDGKTVLSSTTGLVSLEDFEEFLASGIRRFEASQEAVALDTPRPQSKL